MPKRDVNFEEEASYSVEIEETTWKVLEAYNVLKGLLTSFDNPEPHPKISEALDAMYEILQDMLSKDLLIG